MKRIFRVEFDEKWIGCGEWIPGHINVLADDLSAAINKTRKHALGQSYVDPESNKLQKCANFRPTEVKLVAEAEI